MGKATTLEHERSGRGEEELTMAEILDFLGFGLVQELMELLSPVTLLRITLINQHTFTERNLGRNIGSLLGRNRSITFEDPARINPGELAGPRWELV